MLVITRDLDLDSNVCWNLHVLCVLYLDRCELSLWAYGYRPKAEEKSRAPGQWQFSKPSFSVTTDVLRYYWVI